MGCRAVTTVITPATSYDLVSLEDFKLDAGITSDVDDVYLERAISRASSAIMSYCGRVFAVETVKDDFACSGEGSLVLSRYPVISVTATNGLGAGYILDSARGIVSPTDGKWTGSVSFTYEAGLDPIPLDLQGATSEMVKALQFNRSRDPSLRSENILSGLYAYTLFDASTSSAGTAQQVAAILDYYRMQVIA